MDEAIDLLKALLFNFLLNIMHHVQATLHYTSIRKTPKHEAEAPSCKGE